MGILSGIFGRAKLTLSDRQTIWSLFGSFGANQFALKGNSLIQNSYERNSDVFALIRKIVDVSKSVPWIVEKKMPGGTWELVDDTPIHELMANPNKMKGYTWDDIEEQRLVYLLTSGNSYLIGTQAVGFIGIQEVDVLPPFATTIKTNQDFFLPLIRYQFEMDRIKRTFEKEEVQHVKFFNPGYDTVNEGAYGLSLIKVAARAVQVSNDRWDADAALLQNRGAIGLVTDRSQKPMLKEESAQVQKDFDSQTAGPRRFGKIKVTNKDLRFIQMAMSSTDLQLVEKGVVNLRSMCNVFGLDSSLFNDPENKTYNNRLEAEKAMFTNVIMPLSKKIATADTAFIARAFFPDGSHRMRQDFSQIETLQKDKKAEADKDKVVIDGINVILQMRISTEGKVKLLVEEYGYTEEDARIIATPDSIPTE